MQTHGVLSYYWVTTGISKQRKTPVQAHRLIQYPSSKMQTPDPEVMKFSTTTQTLVATMDPGSVPKTRRRHPLAGAYMDLTSH